MSRQDENAEHNRDPWGGGDDVVSDVVKVLFGALMLAGAIYLLAGGLDAWLGWTLQDKLRGFVESIAG